MTEFNNLSTEDYEELYATCKGHEGDLAWLTSHVKDQLAARGSNTGDLGVRQRIHLKKVIAEKALADINAEHRFGSLSSMLISWIIGMVIQSILKDLMNK